MTLTIYVLPIPRNIALGVRMDGSIRSTYRYPCHDGYQFWYGVRNINGVLQGMSVLHTHTNAHTHDMRALMVVGNRLMNAVWSHVRYVHTVHMGFDFVYVWWKVCFRLKDWFVYGLEQGVRKKNNGMHISHDVRSSAIARFAKDIGNIIISSIVDTLYGNGYNGSHDLSIRLTTL